MVLYAVSFPGIQVIAAIVGLYWLGAAALIWAARLVGYVVTRPRGGLGDGVLFLIAPLGALIVAVVLWADAPLRTRWALSRNSFADAAVDVAASQPPSAISRPFNRRLGLYQVRGVRRVNTGVIFYEKAGAILDDAGFAYLPNGPTPDLENGLFERPQFKALGGGWYAWTASW